MPVRASTYAFWGQGNNSVGNKIWDSLRQNLFWRGFQRLIHFTSLSGKSKTSGVEQLCLDLSLNQNHLKNLLKPPSFWFRRLKWSSRSCFSNKQPSLELPTQKNAYNSWKSRAVITWPFCGSCVNFLRLGGRSSWGF